jgi:hypothetical protein
MNLYPQGHQPFERRGIIAEDDITVEGIKRIAHERSLEMCLNAAYMDLMFGRHHLEQLRANLFRAEQLIDRQPLPTIDVYAYLPHDMAAMLETIKAAQKCLKEWLESQACKTILQKYPKRPRPRGKSPATKN